MTPVCATLLRASATLFLVFIWMVAWKEYLAEKEPGELFKTVGGLLLLVIPTLLSLAALAWIWRI